MDFSNKMWKIQDFLLKTAKKGVFQLWQNLIFVRISKEKSKKIKVQYKIKFSLNNLKKINYSYNFCFFGP